MNKKRLLEIENNIYPIISNKEKGKVFLSEELQGSTSCCIIYNVRTVPLLLIETKDSKISDTRLKRIANENAEKNLENLEVSPDPSNKKIKAIVGTNASSVIFTTKSSGIMGSEKVLFCPIMKDFVLFMKKDSPEELVHFIGRMKSLVLAHNNTGNIITEEIFVYDPLTTLLEPLEKKKHYGYDFGIAVLMTNKDIEPQIESSARKILFERISKGPNGSPEAYDIFNNPDRREIFNSLLDNVKEEIRRKYTNEKRKDG